MKITTKAQYEELVEALKMKGYTADTVYEPLEEAGFAVQLADKLYEGIYISRVIAMMRKSSGSAKPLKL